MIRADGLYRLNLAHRGAHGSTGSLDDFASPGYFSTTLVRESVLLVFHRFTIMYSPLAFK
jgi:hypothetical protein